MDQWTHMQCDDNETQSLVKLAKKIKDKRYCRECMKMLPLDQIRPNSFFCHKHYKMVSSWNRAEADGVRPKCIADMHTFGQTTIQLSTKQIRDLMTPNQIQNYKKWCIVPVDPTHPLTVDNAVVVSSIHRMFLISHWRLGHSLIQYQHALTLKK